MKRVLKPVEINSCNDCPYLIRSNGDKPYTNICFCGNVIIRDEKDYRLTGHPVFFGYGLVIPIPDWCRLEDADMPVVKFHEGERIPEGKILQPTEEGELELVDDESLVEEIREETIAKAVEDTKSLADTFSDIKDSVSSFLDTAKETADKLRENAQNEHLDVEEKPKKIFKKWTKEEVDVLNACDGYNEALKAYREKFGVDARKDASILKKYSDLKKPVLAAKEKEDLLADAPYHIGDKVRISQKANPAKGAIGSITCGFFDEDKRHYEYRVETTHPLTISWLTDEHFEKVKEE